MRFPDRAVRRRARGIKIPQSRIFKPVRAGIIGKRLLYHQLGAPVRINGVLRVLFVNGCILRFAVCGAGAGKYDFIYAVIFHGGQQVQRAGHIIPVIFLRIGHAFAHIGIRGKMQHRVKSIFGKKIFQRGRISQVRLFKRHGGGHRFAVAVHQIVRHHAVIPFFRQVFDRMRADIARSAHNQNLLCHIYPPPPAVRRRYLFSLRHRPMPS